MNAGRPDTRTQRLLHAAKEYLTHWAIAGTVVALTGFAPEHWFADLVGYLAIPERVRHVWPATLDVRVALVALGVAIITWDILRRSRAERPALQTATQAGAQTDSLTIAAKTSDATAVASANPPKTNAVIDLSLPDKPSIAVLPFINISGDPEQEYFTDGMTEDIITELSRFRSLFVIARNSSFTYKGKSPDIRQVGKELGVRYVLEGSIRRSGNRIRVTGQLIEAQTGVHIWAEKYDRVLEDIFAVQEELTQAIVGSITPNIDASEISRTQTRQLGNLSAYELALRAWSTAWAALSQADVALRDEAIDLARNALSIDTRCALALRVIAWAQWQHVYLGTARSRAEACKDGIDAATQAIAIDSCDHLSYMYRGMNLINAGQPELGLEDLRHAQVLNPNDARCLSVLGFWEALTGDAHKGVDYANKALRLSPRDPFRATYLNLQAWAYFAGGDYARALESARVSATEAPRMPSPRLCLVVSSVGLGNLDQAKAEFQALKDLAPELIRSRLAGESIGTDPRYNERLITFLRIAAGIEDPHAADPIR